VELERLFARHRDELFRYAARYTGDADVAEDIVQDVFVRLAERPPRHALEMRAWLYRVCTTIAIDWLRSSRRKVALVRDRSADVPVPANAPDPAAEVEREEVRLRVRAALAQLNEKERTVLLMREEGFAHLEIADAVGTTTKSVGTMIARALDKLARRLDLDGG